MSDKPTIFELMSLAMADVQSVGKEGRNTQQNYNFRGIDAVINAVGPVFRKHGIVCVPHSVESHYRDVRTSQDKPSRECTLKVGYRFYGPSGDFIDAEVPGESMDFGDKGAPKAMSVAYRILLLQALCIPTDDPDPDTQSYERAAEPVDRAVQRHTDLEWLAGFETRITLADSLAAVRGLWAEFTQQFADGKVSQDDSARLQTAMTARSDELKTQPAEALL